MNNAKDVFSGRYLARQVERKGIIIMIVRSSSSMNIIMHLMGEVEREGGVGGLEGCMYKPKLTWSRKG